MDDYDIAEDALEALVAEARAADDWEADDLGDFLRGWLQQRRRAVLAGDFPPNVVPMPLPRSASALYARWHRPDNVVPFTRPRARA